MGFWGFGDTVPTTPTTLDQCLVDGNRKNPRTDFMGEVYLYQGQDGK